MSEFAKCALCNQKDSTENLLMPCKCHRWVHRACLNKRRVESQEFFDHCPVCGTEYCIQQKQYPNWRKYVEIYGSVLRDLLVMGAIFLAASMATGKIMRILGIVTKYSDSTVGAMVIAGVVGFIACVCAMFYLLQESNVYLFDLPDCRGDNAAIVFVVIGVAVLIGGTSYWIVITVQERLKRHERAFGVKEKIVLDYGTSDAGPL